MRLKHLWKSSGMFVLVKFLALSGKQSQACDLQKVGRCRNHSLLGQDCMKILIRMVREQEASVTEKYNIKLVYAGKNVTWDVFFFFFNLGCCKQQGVSTI